MKTDPIEKLVNSTGFSVDDLKAYAMKAKDMTLGQADNSFPVPLFAIGYLSDIELSVLCFVINMALYPSNSFGYTWDSRKIGHALNMAPKEVREARNNLIAIGLIEKYEDPLPSGVFSYCPNPWAIDKLVRLFKQVAPEKMKDLRKYLGLMHASEISQDVINRFVEYQNFIKEL